MLALNGHFPGETVLKPSPVLLECSRFMGLVERRRHLRAAPIIGSPVGDIKKTNDVWKNGGLPECFFFGMNIHCISICHLWFSIEMGMDQYL